MTQLKWLIVCHVCKKGNNSITFLRNGDYNVSHSTNIEYALTFNSLEEAISMVVRLNQRDWDKGNGSDILINHPYVVIPHPESIKTIFNGAPYEYTF